MTFLFTDIVESTRLWEASAAQMSVMLARHDELARKSFRRAGGAVFATAGDSFAVAFSTADAAADAGVEL